MKKRAYFITGTDTGVGKTFVAAGLASALRRCGIDVGVMKPVETGCPVKRGVLTPEDALRLKRAAGSLDALDEINPYRFKSPLAPGIAARLDGLSIDFKKVRRCFEGLLERHDAMLVEGAGGLLAPLTDKETIADLAGYLKLQLIIVAASRLGAINQTLLTVECAKKKRVPVKGIILNHPGKKADTSQRYNEGEIKRFSRLPVLGEVPHLKKGPPDNKVREAFEAIVSVLWHHNLL